MDEQGKHLTQAEIQIKKLEAMRQQREQVSAESAPKSPSAPKTEAARIEERLRAMRIAGEKSRGSAPRRPKIEGKQKSSKLTFAQIRLLEEILAKDSRLKGSVITRIALNRFLNIENTAEENDLEARINEILGQLKNR
ncbi:MAG TPA: hypothetical protein VMV05_00990 [bacterium]|nr:hypothetical protein [bacterium]